MFDRCLYFNTAALARKLDKEWAIAFEPFHLTVPQAFMLRAVLERPGMLLRELAEVMAVSRPTVTRALDGLQAKNLIFRHGLERDGREFQVHPTEVAVRMKDALHAAAGTVTTRLKKLMGAREFIDTVAHVKAVRAALS